MAEIARTIEISKDFDFFCFLLGEELLSQIDELSRTIISHDNPEIIESSYSIRMLEHQDIGFDSFSDLLKTVKSEPQLIHSIEITHTIKEKSGIRVLFGQKGLVSLSGFSNLPSFDFEVERLRELITRSREDYNWFIRLLASARFLFLTFSTLIVVSVLLFGSIGYYFYATRVGINIDPALIPNGNQYFAQVADALKSNDTNKKLDILLRAQLRYFTNVKDVLIETRHNIFIELFIIFFLIVLVIVRKIIVRLYPRSFFLFGHNEKVFQVLQTKRQVWGIAIGVAFVVNLAAGLLVAIMTK
jgi:hypothetical protein